MEYPSEDPNIGKRIDELRKGKGLSVQVIADTIGVSPSFIYNLLRGKHLRSSKMTAIANLLGVSHDYLFGVKAEEQPTDISSTNSVERGLYERLLAAQDLTIRILTEQLDEFKRQRISN